MKTLITNLQGQCLFEASRETQAEGLISLHDGKHRKTEIDSFWKGGEIIIDSDDPFDTCQKILEVIKGAKKHGKVLVASDGRGIGPLLNFIANLHGADAIYTCYNKKILQLPRFKLDLSPTRKKIVSLLAKGDCTASQIGEKIGISRAMVYKHLNGLIDLGLVKRSTNLEKYSITSAGKLLILE